MDTLNITLAFASLLIGCIVTWFVSRHYYLKGASDFAKLAAALDKLVSPGAYQKTKARGNDKVSTHSSEKSETPTTGLGPIPRVDSVVERVESVLAGIRQSPDTGGFTISELQQLSDRFHKIAELLKQYAVWRIHVGD